MFKNNGILQSIGNTPIVELIRKNKRKGARILLKLEGNNPGGSVKDRAALWMVRSAEKEGKLTSGKTILEATSGNTGIGLALVGATLGYKVKLIMPKSVSKERISTLEAFGASVILSSESEGIDGAIKLVTKIYSENTKKYWQPNQYSNRANWLSHYETTAVEILNQTGGEIDAFVAGMGTGGTLMGVSRRMKAEKVDVKIVGVEPKIGHSIQGLKNMTESKRPAIFKVHLLDEVYAINDLSAFSMMQQLARNHGLFVGMSGGAATTIAIKVAENMQPNQTVVALIADRGDRYLSTGVFKKDFHAGFVPLY